MCFHAYNLCVLESTKCYSDVAQLIQQWRKKYCVEVRTEYQSDDAKEVRYAICVLKVMMPKHWS